MNNSSLKKENYHFSIVFFAFLIAVYAPYEMYITNINELWFSLKDFIWNCILVGVITIAILEIVLRTVSNYAKDWIRFFILFLGISIYVQGTFLTVNIGKLTGLNFVSTMFITRCFADIIVWLILFIFLFNLYRKKKEIYTVIEKYLPAFLFIVLFLTSIVLFINSRLDEAEKESTSTFISDYELNSFGEDDNIIVFVLDMFDRNYLNTIINQYPEDMKYYDGFNIYNNHTGGYATTDYSFGVINSGHYFHNEKSFMSFCDGNDSYIFRLSENGYNIGNYGGISFPEKAYGYFSNSIQGKVKVKNKIKFMFKIYEMGAFRYAPNVFKPFLFKFQSHLYREKMVISDYNAYSDNNIDIYNAFCRDDIKVDDGKYFKMIYARGTHYPYENDENLNRIEGNEEYPIECARGVLKMVGKYLQNMKEAGVYDNSTIIITADHGYYSDYGMDKFTNPMMMIKRKGSTGDITFNSSPTCHLDIAATIVDLATGESENEFGKSMFEYNESDERERYYYHYYLKEKGNEHRLIEFSIDSDSNKEDAFKLTGNEYTVKGELIDHYKYCKTCQTGNHEGHGSCWHEKANNYPD